MEFWQKEKKKKERKKKKKNLTTCYLCFRELLYFLKSLELPLLQAQTDRLKFANIFVTDFRPAWSMNAKDNVMVPFQHVEVALR